MLRAGIIALVGFGAWAARAQSPELSLREFASGQIKKGVRSIGFGGDGATWGNYALVYRDAGGALVDAGVTAYTNGNAFSFTAVGATTPPLWRGLAVYLIALSEHAENLGLSLSSPGLGSGAAVRGAGANQALFSKVALPLGHGFSAGALLSYELSQFDAVTLAGDGWVRYHTSWRPSGGFGVAWQPDERLLFGVRVILNHDVEVREDPAGTTKGMARSDEYRAGGSVSPWRGALLDAGLTVLDRRNAVNATHKTALEPNLGFEQSLFDKRLVLRVGRDETTWGAGVTVQRAPVKLDVAYLYGLGLARVGPLFGTQSHSVLATFTFDYGAAFTNRS